MGISIYDQLEIIETKECRFCSQVIDQRADRCPYCLVSQSTPSSPNRYSKVACALLVVVVGGSAHFDQGSFDETLDRSVATTDVAPIAAPIEVVESEPEKTAEFDPERIHLIGSAKLLPEWSVRTTGHLPLICASILPVRLSRQ